MAFVKNNQAQDAPTSVHANISKADAVAAALDARNWIQMKNAARTFGSECSEDKCVEACGQGWENNTEHCYLLSNDHLNWTAAEDFCMAEGGHLASVVSYATLNFVAGMMSKKGWDTWN